MKIVVIGGTGLVGSKLLHTLDEHGHDAVAAAPSTGVNTFAGVGLPEVLAGRVGRRRRVELADARRRRDGLLPNCYRQPAQGRVRTRV